VLGGLIVTVLWIVYWQFVHHRCFKITDKDYISNEELLKFDFEQLDKQAYHTEIVGFGFLLGGLGLISVGNISWIVMGLGFFALLLGVAIAGRSTKISNPLRERIKEKEENSSKTKKQSP